ncbi:MAG: gliding motility-associated C-terminal domain-containing protein [Chitinophagales bacterium]
MKKFSPLFLLSTLLVVLTTCIVMAAPVINLNLLTPTVVCSSGNDTTRYSVSANGIPANTNIVVYQSTDSTFNPYNSQGDSIGYIPGNAIPRDTINFGACVKTLGIFIDACGATGQEGRNEYMILTSGTGIKVSNLAINYDPANSNSGNDNDNDINTGTNPCSFKTPNAALISNLQTGSCNASNIIAASPTDSIPPNSIILCFTSDNVTANYSVNGLCNLGYPIYVVQSSCTRTIGAFTNAASCSSTPTTRYRRTLAIDKRQNCQDNFVYDRCGLFDLDGTYAIRQAGTDTARVSNNGIRRNAIDSCGGIDYAQLNFSADTILKFRISPNFCNDGYHYIKAITHPNGSQPVSNTIKYKLVCNDVSATTRTSTICSGESAVINLSSTDPNANLSWTVSGGTGITGAVAGTGNSINQVLTNNGNTKDSVMYTAISYDAGCVKTQSVKVVVNPPVQPQISGNLIICNNGSVKLSVQGQFDSLRWSTGQTANSIDAIQAGPYSVTAYKNGCSGIANVNVTNTNVNISISGNTEVCNGNSVTLVANGTFDSVRWNNGAAGNQLTVSSSGSYTATGYLNGCSASTTQRVTDCQSQDCNPDITGNRVFCDGDSITLDAGSGFTSYTWNTGAVSQTIKVKTPGKYVVSVTGQNNCTGKDSVQVLTNPIPQVSISGNTTFCIDSQTDLTANTDADSLRWSTNETTTTISVSETQNYSVTVYKNGCSKSASVQVSSLDPPSQFNLGNDTVFCGNFSKVLSTGNQSTVWSTGVTAAQITVTTPGTYTATITNDCGSATDEIVIFKNDLPVVNLGNDTAFCEGELLLNAPVEMRSYLWSTGSQLPSITVTEEGTYSVKVTDENGCSNSDTIDISSNCFNDLWIPNAFTPNGDGVNDVFLVRGNPRNTTIERFVIYNRWGNKVFEANNILPSDVSAGWDGKYKGESSPFEVYGYEVIARFTNGEKKTLKGNVTLLK